MPGEDQNMAWITVRLTGLFTFTKVTEEGPSLYKAPGAPISIYRSSSENSAIASIPSILHLVNPNPVLRTCFLKGVENSYGCLVLSIA